MTPAGLPGGCSAPPVGPDPEGSTRIASPGDALLPPERMLGPPVGMLSPPGEAGLGGPSRFCLPPGMLCPPPPPGMLPIAPRAGPHWGCSALPCPGRCSAPPRRD